MKTIKTLKKFEIKKSSAIKGGKTEPTDLACIGILIEHMQTPKMGF